MMPKRQNGHGECKETDTPLTSSNRSPFLKSSAFNQQHRFGHSAATQSEDAASKREATTAGTQLNGEPLRESAVASGTGSPGGRISVSGARQPRDSEERSLLRQRRKTLSRTSRG